MTQGSNNSGQEIKSRRGSSKGTARKLHPDMIRRMDDAPLPIDPNGWISHQNMNGNPHPDTSITQQTIPEETKVKGSSADNLSRRNPSSSPSGYVNLPPVNPLDALKRNREAPQSNSSEEDRSPAPIGNGFHHHLCFKLMIPIFQRRSTVIQQFSHHNPTIPLITMVTKGRTDDQQLVICSSIERGM